MLVSALVALLPSLLLPSTAYALSVSAPDTALHAQALLARDLDSDLDTALLARALRRRTRPYDRPPTSQQLRAHYMGTAQPQPAQPQQAQTQQGQQGHGGAITGHGAEDDEVQSGHGGNQHGNNHH